ncbi:MAG: gamma carbonic anhydrase family protein [Oligoflexales bacterium]
MSKTLHSYKEHKPTLGKGVFLAPGVHIIGDVHIGDDSNIWFNTVIRGDVHHIRIGKRTNIQDNTTIHVTTGLYPTLLGNDVTVGHNAILHGCTIEDECLIGMGAIVMDQVTVGRQCIIGAGSLLPQGKTYPEGSLIVGSPATVRRKLSKEEIAGLKHSATHYVDIAKSYNL